MSEPHPDVQHLRSGMWVSYQGRIVKVVTVTRSGGGAVKTMSGRFGNGDTARFDAERYGVPLPAGVLPLAAVVVHGWRRPEIRG